MENIFEQQLKDLKTDTIDLYMLHSLNEDYWKMFRELDVFEFLDDILSSGKAKHVGFSAHTEMDWIVDIIDDYDKFEFGLTQLNYLDERYQSGREGVEYLASHNLGTIIMEPLRGGRLVQNVPQDIMKLWDMAEEKRTPLEWAFQYLWNMEEVNTVLSGMNSIEQVKENIEIAAGSAMHYFSLESGTRADSCLHCDDCLNHCPQMIHISEDLKKVEEFFGRKYTYF